MEVTKGNRVAWSPNVIFSIGIIFSFLAATLFYFLNYRKLGTPEKNKNLLTGAAGLVLIFTIAILFPLDEVISTIVIFASNLLFLLYFYSDQMVIYEEFIKDGGKKASPVFMITGSITVGLVVFSLLIFADKIESEYLNSKADRAIELFEKNEYNKSEEIFIDIVNDYPEYLSGHMYLVLIYFDTDRADKAVEKVQFLHKNYPNDSDLIDFIKSLKQDKLIIDK